MIIIILYTTKIIIRNNIYDDSDEKIWFTLQYHSLSYALFKPTVLTPVPLSFCYFASALRYTRVYPSVLDGTFEEPFTSV